MLTNQAIILYVPQPVLTPELHESSNALTGKNGEDIEVSIAIVNNGDLSDAKDIAVYDQDSGTITIHTIDES